MITLHIEKNGNRNDVLKTREIHLH